MVLMCLMETVCTIYISTSLTVAAQNTDICVDKRTQPTDMSINNIVYSQKAGISEQKTNNIKKTSECPNLTCSPRPSFEESHGL